MDSGNHTLMLHLDSGSNRRPWDLSDDDGPWPILITYGSARPNGLKLTRDLVVVVSGNPSMRFSFKAGHLWDGASIPRVIRRTNLFLKPHSRPYQMASLLHDSVCESATTYSERLIGDFVFYRVLLCSDVSRTMAASMLTAVILRGLYSISKLKLFRKFRPMTRKK